MHSNIDFGYPWFLTHGHLAAAAAGFALLALGRWRGWGRWVMGGLGLLTLWAVAGFAIARFVLDFNGRPVLPTETFLASGKGKVLDMGAGTGRSALMVLESRPDVTLVAIDSFEQSYVDHFGNIGNSRIVMNLTSAGVERRATVQKADMRQLPFGAGEFDGIVSAYAIDHLNREGIQKSLAEAARVVKPGGEFLLMLVNNDFWLRFAYGPLFMHGFTRNAGQWAKLLNDAGFEVLEQGQRPATNFLLARRR
ncbi:MAG: methyltransferase domain-containing protein [Bryobacteraceae bacterium]